jgi:hypothetical protein
MFQSLTIIRKLALNLLKVIFMLKHSVKCHGMACVSHVTHTPLHDMLPHNRIINNDVIPPNVLT